jgi:type VI secretion system protein ImpL
VAPLANNGVAASGAPQRVFQLLPTVVPGVQEYTIDIDGQQLRYRNSTPAWTSMVYPGPGVRGARITAITGDGRSVELFNEPGEFGLQRMIDAAEKKRKDGGANELRWSKGAVALTVDLRVTSSPAAGGDGESARRGFAGLHLPDTIVGRVDTRVASAGGAQ